MSREKIKRFSGWQIVLHWGQAIMYLVLIATGVLMLFQRLSQRELLPPEELSLVHRTTGLVLIGFLVSVLIGSWLSGRLGEIKRDIISCLVWKRHDFIWLLKVGFNVLWKTVRLPGAGRFNAGQKLHGAFVFFAIPIFAASGLPMHYSPRALGPWVIHTILFLVAAAFLAVHLFLALINPPTRKSLLGIFGGYVSREYANSHHSLWTGTSEPKEQAPFVSIKAISVVLIAIVCLAALGTWAYGPGQLPAMLTNWQWSDAMGVIDPGCLTASHAEDTRIDGCLSCHKWFGNGVDSACLSCHQKVRSALAMGDSYHSQFSKDCASCHFDHKGYSADIRNLDSETFDHRQARFNLKGKHQTAKCLDCHSLKRTGTSAQQQRYIGVKYDRCLTCHANPHDSEKADDCVRCHNEQSWKEKDLLFVHNRDCDFPIDAIHSVVACNSCHKGQGFPLYESLDKTCKGCHSDTVLALAGRLPGRGSLPDPHSGRVECIKCHLPEIANPTLEQYAQTCRDCHNQHYGDLLFDWNDSLHARQVKAEEILEELGNNTTADTEQLREIISQAKMAGMHNVQLSRSLFDTAIRHRDR